MASTACAPIIGVYAAVRVDEFRALTATGVAYAVAPWVLFPAVTAGVWAGVAGHRRLARALFVLAGLAVVLPIAVLMIEAPAWTNGD